MKTFYSINDEDFRHGDIHEAAEEIWNDSDTQVVGDTATIYEADFQKIRASELIPSDLFGDMQLRAEDEATEEAAWDWIADSDQEKDLQDMVAKAVDQWADKHGMQPAFYRIVSNKSRPIEIIFTDEDGGFEIVHKIAERKDGE